MEQPQTSPEPNTNTSSKTQPGAEHLPAIFSTTGVDITEQKGIEQLLLESEQRFQAAVAAIDGVLWTNNSGGEMEGVQTGWASLTGQSMEEYRGYGWANAVHPDDALATIDAWNKTVHRRETFVFEHRVKMKNGEWGLFSVRAVPLVNADGSIREWVGVHTNITKARKSTEALRQSEEKFRSLANSISQMAWMANKDGWIYWYNERWYGYTGTSFEEMEGWGWDKVHHPDQVEKVVSATKELWNTNQPFELTFPLRRHDGVYRWFLTRVYPLLDERGEVQQWIGTNTDIDDYKKAMQLKDEFLNMASHELKTPLTSLKAFTQILEMQLKAGDNSSAATLLQKMDQQINKLNRLVIDLLDVNKIEKGQLQYNIEPFNFNILVSEVVEEMQRFSTTHTIQTRLDGPVILNGDRNRIEQVISNLIANAIKYSPSQDTIIVSTQSTTEEVIFSVQDFGIGVPEADLSNIFNRFYRVPGKYRESFPGLGTGLFIASEIISRHQGIIKAESEEGKGSTFSFYIPR
jgi:PAS domain S-box-containing protein